MRLAAVLFVSAMCVTACGNDAASMARDACDLYEVGIGVRHLPAEEVERYKPPDGLQRAAASKAAAAADKQDGFSRLAGLLSEWAADSRQSYLLTEDGFDNLDAGERAELSRLSARGQTLAPLIESECNKART